MLTSRGTLPGDRAQGLAAEPCLVQHEQLLRKGPCSACRTSRSSHLSPGKGIGECEQYLEQTWTMEDTPSPAQHYCTGENRSLQDSAPSLLTVLLISSPYGSVSGDEGHAHK